MSDDDKKIDHLFMEQFRALRDEQGRLLNEIKQIADGQKTTNERLSSIEYHVMGLHTTSVRYNDELDALKARVAALEGRSDRPTS